MPVQSVDVLLAWDRPRGKRHSMPPCFLSNAAVDRSSSCGAGIGAGTCGNNQRRRPQTRKDCAGRGMLPLRRAGSMCWEPSPLFEAKSFASPDLERWASCVLERDWTPSTPTVGRDVCSSISRPLTPADESRGPRRSSSLPGLTAGAIAAAALRAGDSTPTEGRRAKPRPPRLSDDEMLSYSQLPSPLLSPAGSLAQAGVALIHDAASERSRSSAGSPMMGNTRTEAPSCQMCSKILSSRSTALEATENRVCNACEAKRELNEVSLRRTSSKSVWPARGNGHFSSSWELIDFSASK